MTIEGLTQDWAATYGDRARERVGFFTDTTVCIGCKACEVACKEWNGVPEDGLVFTGDSLDNTGSLGASTWRHVAFIEQSKPQRVDGAGDSEDEPFRWLMSSDVCKHCTHAACLDVCPTGALFRTEFGTVVVQDDVCNGCGYCVPACPFGVIDRRELEGAPGGGIAQKCTLCYDRLTRAIDAGLRQGLPDRVDPVRTTRRAPGTCCAPTLGRAGRGLRGRPPLRRGSGRRRRRLRRVLPAARRA